MLLVCHNNHQSMKKKIWKGWQGIEERSKEKKSYKQINESLINVKCKICIFVILFCVKLMKITKRHKHNNKKPTHIWNPPDTIETCFSLYSTLDWMCSIDLHVDLYAHGTLTVPTKKKTEKKKRQNRSN